MEMSQEMETHSIKQAEKTVEKHDLDKDINHIGPIMLSIDTSRLPSKPQPVIYNFSPTRSFYESNISPRHAPEYNHSGSDYQYYHKFTANQRLDTSSHAIKYLVCYTTWYYHLITDIVLTVDISTTLANNINHYLCCRNNVHTIPHRPPSISMPFEK